MISVVSVKEVTNACNFLERRTRQLIIRELSITIPIEFQNAKVQREAVTQRRRSRKEWK